MKIGLPKEIKDNEYRVGLTPAGVHALVAAGHEVFVQKMAGEGSGFADEQYVKAGGQLLETADDVRPTRYSLSLISFGNPIFIYLFSNIISL